MTIEEAINVVRNIYQTDKEKKALETLIPELKESEDERVRQRLINLIRELANAKLPILTSGYFVDGQDKKYIAYLEKQKDSLHISETSKGNAKSFTDEQKPAEV